MEKERKGYVIFDQQVAGALMFMKNRLKKSRPDRNDITKNVFIFEEDDKFLEDLNYIKSNKDILYSNFIINK